MSETNEVNLALTLLLVNKSRSDGVIVSLDTIALEISTIACLQAIVFLKEILINY